jgi:hypothetical protein
MLEQTIAKAEAIYLSKVEELAQHQKFRTPTRYLTEATVPYVTEDSLRAWLADIKHNPHGRHKKLRCYATAHYVKQLVVYNPLFLEQQSEKDILDTILHELGHLFTWHFMRARGHGYEWRHVGTIVGYAEVGSTTDTRRKRYRSYAAHANSVATPEATIGQIATSAPERNRSSVGSPVSRVWLICDTYGHHFSRKAIIGMCVKAGINRNTASTQYYHWKKAQRGVR